MLVEIEKGFSEMSPFAAIKPYSNGFYKNSPDLFSSGIVTIDVGGQIFQTTKQTLSLSGGKSLLSKFSNADGGIPFIDRDPEYFSVLLSLLRTGNLPSKAKSFDIQDLIFESRFYGIENILINSQSNPSQFEAFNLERSAILPLTGRDSPSAISTTPYGSVHVAHGSKVTSFDWSLRRKSTILTNFMAIDSLLALSSNTAAAGATDFSGLQIIDLNKGFVKETLNWENVTKSGSTVQAIGVSPEYLFTSFESARRNSNCIMIYDLQDGFRPVSQISHNEIFGAELLSAIPATKLRWLPTHNLLMASGSHSGPSGVVGNIKLWDIRSGNVVWEIKETVDCFSDVTFSDDLSAMFKVGVNSGELFYMDLRKNIGTTTTTENSSWICLGDSRKILNGKKEGYGSNVESNGNQVFCSKGGNIELWSEVMINHSSSAIRGENGRKMEEERVFRKNFMGRTKDMNGNRISKLSFGGNKMFVTRKDQQHIEVWQSSS